MKYIIIIIFLITIFGKIHAQPELITKEYANEENIEYINHLNTIKFIHGDFIIPRRTRFKIGPEYQNTSLGFTYERRIFKNFYLGATYFEWEAFDDPFSVLDDDNFVFINMSNSGSFTPVGSLTGRKDYQMFDFFASYRYTIASTNHCISASIGPSLAKGVDIHLTEFYMISPVEAHQRYTSYKKTYYGGVLGFSYNYYFIRKRLVTGVYLKSRHYKNWEMSQLDFGLQIGVNF